LYIFKILFVILTSVTSTLGLTVAALVVFGFLDQTDPQAPLMALVLALLSIVPAMMAWSVGKELKPR
jgi:hypothetical protein